MNILTMMRLYLWLYLVLIPSEALARSNLRPEAVRMSQARQKKGLLKGLRRWTNNTSASPEPTCIDSSASGIIAPKTNIWNGLTDQEAASVAKWLLTKSDLNLTTADDAGEWDNSILLIELMQPNKSDALSYIDGIGAPPTRYAHVVIDHRASVDPYYGDILVGPLPVQNGCTSWQPLEYPYTRKTKGRVRNLDADEGEIFYLYLDLLSTGPNSLNRQDTLHRLALQDQCINI